MTSRLPSPRLRPIDKQSLRLQVRAMGLQIIALIKLGKFREVFKVSCAMRLVYKSLIKASVANHNFDLKLRMLACTKWRMRVLADLGGPRGLAAWEAASLKARTQAARPHGEAGLQPAPPAWWLEKFEQQKAHIRENAKACRPDRVFKDPFRVDSEGQFRLAPRPRNSRPRGFNSRHPCAPGFDIDAYRYDPLPRTNFTGVNAVCSLWPDDFYAGEQFDADRDMRVRKAQQKAQARRMLKAKDGPYNPKADKALRSVDSAPADRPARAQKRAPPMPLLLHKH